MFLPAEIIKKKRNGRVLSTEEIRFMINSFVDESLPPYQMSALLMSIYFKGLNAQESADLTQVMIDSGDTVDFSELGINVCDKHSTGGVGDKASLILAPIAAACGVHVPMIAGRGLGHTGGTLDKLEAIPGFKIDLSLSEFKKTVIEHRLAIIGQTGEICPADKKMYAMRDVTGTIESLGLIGGSIMSKKIAEGIRGLALDVKVGSGAFMKTEHDAEQLARFLIDIGNQHGVKTAAYVTQMNQPLGRFIGNSLEIKECLEVLKGQSFKPGEIDFYADTRDLSIELASLMIFLSGQADSLSRANDMAKQALDSGKALKEFELLVERQGGQLSKLPQSSHTHQIIAKGSGFVSAFDTESIGVAGIVLGAGRARASDQIDPTAGIEVHKKIGCEVQAGDTLFTLYCEDSSKFANVEEILMKSMSLSLQPVEKQSLIIKKIME